MQFSKSWTFVLLMLVTNQALSLQVIPLTLNHSDSANKLNLSSPIGVPARSKATVGKVETKKIDAGIFTTVIFIIGPDSYSRHWLAEHQQQLQDIQAIGFITNVDDFDTIIQLQQKSQLPLLPVNVDPLLKLLDIKHYPLVIAKGEIWQ